MEFNLIAKLRSLKVEAGVSGSAEDVEVLEFFISHLQKAKFAGITFGKAVMANMEADHVFGIDKDE